MKKIKLGDMVVDKVTGFEGTAVAVIKYMNGCVQYEVQPVISENGEMVKHSWIDEPQLKIIKKNGKKESPRTYGGIRAHPD